jgi:hypothetical protein
MWAVKGTPKNPGWLCLQAREALDGDRVFICQDTVGDSYLAYMCDCADQLTRYLITTCTAETRQSLVAGQVNLRDALRQNRLWIVDVDSNFHARQAYFVVENDLPPEALPRPGVMLRPDQGVKFNADPEPLYPRVVHWAGVIWCACGAWVILDAFLLMLAMVVTSLDVTFADWSGAAVSTAVGAAVILMGYRAIHRQLPDVMLPAVLSFALGAWPLACGCLFFVSQQISAFVKTRSQGLTVFVGWFHILAGVGFIAAGAMALQGRQPYLTWRLWRGEREPGSD